MNGADLIGLGDTWVGPHLMRRVTGRTSTIWQSADDGSTPLLFAQLRRRAEGELQTLAVREHVSKDYQVPMAYMLCDTDIFLCQYRITSIGSASRACLSVQTERRRTKAYTGASQELLVLSEKGIITCEQLGKFSGISDNGL